MSTVVHTEALRSILAAREQREQALPVQLTSEGWMWAWMSWVMQIDVGLDTIRSGIWWVANKVGEVGNMRGVLRAYQCP